MSVGISGFLNMIPLPKIYGDFASESHMAIAVSETGSIRIGRL